MIQNDVYEAIVSHITDELGFVASLNVATEDGQTAIFCTPKGVRALLTLAESQITLTCVDSRHRTWNVFTGDLGNPCCLDDLYSIMRKLDDPDFFRRLLR